MAVIIDTCDRCLRWTGEGSHGVGLCPYEPRRLANAVAAVTWPGGRTFENLGHEPQTFYSPSEYKTYLRTHNLDEFVRHVPTPGSDKSPHTRSWATMDAQTLANAAMLVGGPRPAPEPETYIQSMTVTVTEELGTVRAAKATFGVFEHVD